MLCGEPEPRQPTGVCVGAARYLPGHRHHVSAGRVRLALPHQKRHQAGGDQDRQAGAADDPDRSFHGSLHGPGHCHRGLLLLRAAQQASVGNYAQLYVRHGAEQAETELCRVHAQVLHVSAGGDHVGGLDLVREDVGHVEDFLQALLLGQQSLRELHVQRR